MLDLLRPLTGAESDAPPAVPDTARRVLVGFARLGRWLDGFTTRHGAPTIRSDDIVVHLTGTDGAQAWIEVPFPPLAGADLLEHVSRPRRIGVLLVRRGGYAVGVFDGRKLVDSKVGTGYVQGATKAGGWSQQRFARRRANQADALFGEAANVAVRILVPAEPLDGLVTGGDRAAVEAVLADVRLTGVAAQRIGPWLAVPDPRLKILQATPDRFLAVQISLDP